ncbi:sensor histidine kinase [Tenacibaculum sp. SG-28]|uniref:sensor histidine kinase n=1 Tax=Tenacibaculum sp. SG-28 TaxID=754426 RepID=UPI000CF3E721|nr:histidine kinase [Tenacibaculum sp. SG-28]PQJ23223.1 hypothetical protein BSU00_03085 [Tenacibaculum sp. SG-28]
MKIKHETTKYHIAIFAIWIIFTSLRSLLIVKENILSGSYASFLLLFLALYTFIYWVNFTYFIPQTIGRAKYWLYSVYLLLSVVSFAVLRYLIEEVIVFHITGMHNYAEDSRVFMPYVLDNAYYAFQAVFMAFIVYFILDVVRKNDRINELKLQQKTSELQVLKAQLEPHFLFNTLNAFYVELVHQLPKVADDILRLSELLRFVTYETQNENIALSDDLKFLEDYIFFYRKRYEDSLHVVYNFTGEKKGYAIPSMVLLHFVENVFKHGDITNKDFPAQISVASENKFLIVSTKNKINTSEKYTNTGIGTNSIVKKLDLLYGKSYVYEINFQNNIFEVMLKIPLWIQE